MNRIRANAEAEYRRQERQRTALAPICGDADYMAALRLGQRDHAAGKLAISNPYPLGELGQDTPLNRNRREGWSEGWCREANRAFFAEGVKK